jgi:hypothetical protein
MPVNRDEELIRANIHAVNKTQMLLSCIGLDHLFRVFSRGLG